MVYAQGPLACAPLTEVRRRRPATGHVTRALFLAALHLPHSCRAGLVTVTLCEVYTCCSNLCGLGCVRCGAAPL